MVTIVIIRDIENGEELLYQYGESHEVTGRTTKAAIDLQQDDERNSCMVCRSEATNADDSIRLSCRCSAIFYRDRARIWFASPRTWFASRCKLTFVQNSSVARTTGEAKIENSWKVNQAEFECPLCKGNVSRDIAADLLDAKSGDFAEKMEEFEGKTVSLQMEERESDSNDSDNDYEETPPSCRKVTAPSCGSRLTSASCCRGSGAISSRPRLRRRLHPRHSSSRCGGRRSLGRSWTPRRPIWRDGTKVKMYMELDGRWEKGEITQWSTPGERKEKFLLDFITSHPNEELAKCPNYKRGMYKVKWNSIDETGNAAIPNSTDEDWFF